MQRRSELRQDGLPLSEFTDDHDPYTLRRLAALGVGPGSACLDVGAGGGSVARWLAERAGPGGRVVAVDVEEERLRRGLEGSSAEAWIVDITREPLPSAEFDLVHSRLMLCITLERDEVLRGLVDAARPGATVVLADLDFTTHRPAFLAPAWNRVWPAFLRGLTHAGWDVAYGRRLVALLEREGLEQVQGETTGRYVRGGSPACRMSATALERAAHVVPDLTAEDLAAVRADLDDPERAFVAPDFTIAWGRRPAVA